MVRPLPIAVLVSGEGTILEALGESIQGGHIPARIVLVVADRPYAPAIERARTRGLPTVVLPYRGVPEAKWAFTLDQELKSRGAEVGVLAGFLALLPPTFVRAWTGRLINVHPSLLPQYGGRGMYGRHVLEAILASRDPETGVTVHLVDEGLDTGPILEQFRVPVDPGETAETLREKIRPLEIRALGDVLRRFADGIWPLPYVPAAAPPRDRSESTRLDSSAP